MMTLTPDGQLHEIICYCDFGATVNAATAAHHIRVVLTGNLDRLPFASEDELGR